MNVSDTFESYALAGVGQLGETDLYFTKMIAGINSSGRHRERIPTIPDCDMPVFGRSLLRPKPNREFSWSVTLVLMEEIKVAWDRKDTLILLARIVARSRDESKDFTPCPDC